MAIHLPIASLSQNRQMGKPPRHHMSSESAWDWHAARRQLVVDAKAHFGYPSALLLDERAFGKKGNLSAGLARQWNGHLGKVDNCHVGVFSAVTGHAVASVVDADLYLPETWTKEATRCEALGGPAEAQPLRTTGEIARTACCACGGKACACRSSSLMAATALALGARETGWRASDLLRRGALRSGRLSPGSRTRRDCSSFGEESSAPATPDCGGAQAGCAYSVPTEAESSEDKCPLRNYHIRPWPCLCQSESARSLSRAQAAISRLFHSEIGVNPIQVI